MTFISFSSRFSPNSFKMNSTNTNCSIAQYFSNASDFFHCYAEMFQANVLIGVLGILIVLLAVVFNTLVIVILARKPPTKMTVFDRLMIAHCVVDGLTGLVDVPFFHFQSVMGFWPFGRIPSLLWTSYDNGINVITNLHMLWMTFIRLRSISVPSSFEKELLARRPVLVSALIWSIGFVIWAPITFYFGVDEFTTLITIPYLYIEAIFIFITWFIPLVMIILFAMLIILILNKRRLRKRFSISHDTTNHQNHRTITLKAPTHSSSLVVVKRTRVFRLKQNLKTLFSLGPQTRFQIIIAFYCVQWFPSCVIAIIDPLCRCVPTQVSSSIYWLTFTVCFTDPLVILLLNPNVGVCRIKHKTPGSR